MKPLVSVIVPTYNGKKYIRECIESILCQDIDPLEVIVIDDASTDDTPSLVDHAGIILIKNKTNLGECETCMYAFSLARGKYVARLSQDDAYINASHLSKQVEILDQTGADFCYNTKTLLGPDIKSSTVVETKWLFSNRLDNIILAVPDIAFEIWKRRNPINNTSLMFRGTSYKKVNYPTWYKTSWDAVVEGRALRLGMFGLSINDLGTFYRIHPDQQMNGSLFLEELKTIRKGWI